DREPHDASLLTRHEYGNVNEVEYERQLSDGSTEVYSWSDHAGTNSRKLFLRRIIDPAGNAVAFYYDWIFRLIWISDALGRRTNISYKDEADLLIRMITDPFGRSATLTYYANGDLWSIKDVMNMVTSFSYYGPPTPGHQYSSGK